MSALRRRLDRLAATAPPACPDAFHVTWHVVHEDAATGELPPPPVCPTCGTSPRVHRLYLRGVSLEDL